MFRVLGCVPQGYYQWAKRNDDDDESDRVLVAEIRDVMAESRQTYDIRRVTQALKERGFHVNHKRVERLMREHYIRCKKVKRFKKTTNSSHKFPASEDRLQRHQLTMGNGAAICGRNLKMCGFSLSERSLVAFQFNSHG